MCKWTKEDFAHKPTRDQIPFSEFRKCGEDITVIDLALRGNPKLKEHLRKDQDQQPLIAQSPTLPADTITATPTTSAGVGLIAFGAGLGLLGWLVRSALRPTKNAN